jgi:hypothetical protein
MDKFVAEERERQFKEKERIVTLNSKIQEGNGSTSDPTEDNNMKDFQEEVKRFKKWLKNNKGKKDLSEFKSDLLSDKLKENLS